MNRPVALLAALVLAAVSVSSACMANSASDLRFELKPSVRAGELQLALWSGNDRHNGLIGSSFAANELSGIDPATLRLPGERPVSFAYVREAGRIDCSGTARDSVATGRCTFAPNTGFGDFLASSGIGRPTRDEAYEMTMTGVGRDLVNVLAQYRYPRPTIEKLTELSAVGVDRPFIASFAGRSYAPKTLDDLTEFAALDVTPDYVDALGALRRPWDFQRRSHRAESRRRRPGVHRFARQRWIPQSQRRRVGANGGAPNQSDLHQQLRAHRIRQPAGRHARPAQSARRHAGICPLAPVARTDAGFRR
jgi:hypothetical protein